MSSHAKLRPIRTLALLVLVSSLPAVAAASDLGDAVAAILAEDYPPGGPGASAIVVENGEVLFAGASGSADLEHDVPLTAESVFRLGSITKQFTAVALLMLEEQGKLSLDDPIIKYLPDYPTHGHEITIRHLLTHTSGIFSYTAIPGYMDQKIRNDLTTDELIEVFRAQPMDFAPGERFSYSNSGYVLAGAIIEKVSGQSYAEFIQEHIFGPLGMTHSYYGSASRIIPNRARGYMTNDDGYAHAPYLSMTQPHAAGSLLSTVGDLARWDAALYTDALLTEESRESLYTPFTFNNGEKSEYALGFIIGEFRGAESISHGGGINGFVTHAIRLPEQRVYVAVLSNSVGRPPGPAFVAQKIAAVAIGKPFPDFMVIDVAPEILETYVGVYRIDDDTTRVVTVEDGLLYTQRQGGGRLEAHPHSETGFFYDNSFSHFEIVKDADGNVTGMRMYQNGAEEAEEAVLTDEPVPTRETIEVDPAILDRYVGKYELSPSFALTVTREDDRIFAQATGQPRFEIFAESETEFFLEVVDAQITFVVGAGGAAESLILHQGGRDMPGKRVD